MPPQWQRSQSVTPEMSITCRLRTDDVNEILAYIDYYTAKSLDPKKFEESVITHLKGSRQKDFTFKQIDEKMKNLWGFKANRSLTDQTDRRDHTHIYRVGTKALHFFDHSTIALIKARMQQMMNESAPKACGRSRKRNRRKRKAGPRRPGIDGQDRASKRAKTAPTEFLSYTPQTRTIQDSITVQVLPTSTREREGSHPRDYCRNLSAVPDSQHSESPHSPPFSSTSNIAEDYRSLSAGYSYAKPENIFTSLKGLGSHESRLQLPSECEKDLEYFRQELSKAQSKIQILEKKIQCEENARKISERDGGGPNQQTLVRYFQEIENLKSQVHDKRSLQPFTAVERHMPFDVAYFQANMDDIGGVIGDFMSCAETLDMCNNINLEEQGDDLRLLYRRVVGESPGTLQSVSFHSLLRSLLSAAVCEWVLECDFHEHLLTTCPLRDTMLAHLATQDGVNVARNLDFATHHTLMECEYFQEELLPRRADALVDRISTTLKPLFGLQKALELWEIDILDAWDRKRRVLKNMFVSALRVKTRALVTKDVFEVIFPPQAYEYDSYYMDIEDISGDDGDSVPGETPFVRLCLVPGLRKQPFDRKRVDYSSFQKPGSGSAAPFDRITKSLVTVYR